MAQTMRRHTGTTACVNSWAGEERTLAGSNTHGSTRTLRCQACTLGTGTPDPEIHPDTHTTHMLTHIHTEITHPQHRPAPPPMITPTARTHVRTELRCPISHTYSPTHRHSYTLALHTPSAWWAGWGSRA